MIFWLISKTLRRNFSLFRALEAGQVEGDRHMGIMNHHFRSLLRRSGIPVPYKGGIKAFSGVGWPIGLPKAAFLRLLLVFALKWLPRRASCEQLANMLHTLFSRITTNSAVSNNPCWRRLMTVSPSLDSPSQAPLDDYRLSFCKTRARRRSPRYRVLSGGRTTMQLPENEGPLNFSGVSEHAIKWWGMQEQPPSTHTASHKYLPTLAPSHCDYKPGTGQRGKCCHGKLTTATHAMVEKLSRYAVRVLAPFRPFPCTPHLCSP